MKEAKPVSEHFNQNYLDLISRIYDLPLQPGKWPSVLEEFADVIGAYGASLHVFDPIHAEHRSNIYAPIYDQVLARLGMTIDEYNARFAHYDQPASTHTALMRERKFVPDMELLGYNSFDDYREHPPVKFFNQHMGVNHRAATRLTLNGAWSDLMALQFANQNEAITDSEVKIGSFFVDHFAKSVELCRAFGVLKSRFNGVFSALDRFHIGIYVLSPNGTPVVNNLEADRQLDAADGITLSRNGKLQPVNVEQRNQFQKAIINAIDTAQAHCNQAETLMSLERKSGEDPYLVEIAPIRDTNEIDSQFSGALVFVIDPTKSDIVSTAGMQTLYGLTDSEAEICKLVAEGFETENIAEIRGLTRETVRTYIKQILQKAGVKNRAQLVRRALNINLPIDPPSKG